MAKIGDIRTKPGTGVMYVDSSNAGVNIPATESTTATEGNGVGVISVTGDNIGEGEGVYAGSNGIQNVLMEFRSIKAGAGITLQGDARSIVITSTGVTTAQLEGMSGVLGVHQGGTGATSLDVNSIVLGNGVGPLQSISAPASANQYLTWNGSAYEWLAKPHFESGVTSVALLAGSNKVSVTGGAITSAGQFTVDVTEANLALNNIGGILNPTKGGTGAATLPLKSILLGNGTSPVTGLGVPTSANSFLGWNGTDYVWQAHQTGVTSVGMVGSNGIEVTGTTVTSTGSFGISLTPTTVVPGTYTLPTIKVDSYGRVTEAASTTITSVTGTNLAAGPTAFAGKVGDALTFRQFAVAGGLKVTQTADTITFGTDVIGLDHGGTGNTSYTVNGLLVSNGTRFQSISVPTANTYLAYDGTNYTWRSAQNQVVVSSQSAALTVTPVTTTGVSDYQIALNESSLQLNNLAGTVSVTKGGTGATTLAMNKLLLGNGTGAIKTVADPTESSSNFYLKYDGTAIAWVPVAQSSGIQNLTAGTGLTTTGGSSTAGGSIETNGTIHLTTLGTQGSYPVLNAVVDSTGRITSASDASATVLARSNHTGTMSAAYLTPGSATQSTDTYAFNAPVSATVITADDIQVASLATVAKSGSYNDLLNKPTLFSGAYEDLTGKPALFSGSYDDLTDKPTVVNDYNDLVNKPSLSTVATSGSYNDLANLPSIPSITGLASEAFVTSAISDIELFSGSYDDLTDKPTIPSIAGLATEAFVTSAISDIELFSGSYDDLTDVPAAYSLPIATSSVLGGVIAGGGIDITAEGVISISASAGLGSVTSVGLTTSSGPIVITGGPITGAGNISVDLDLAAIQLSELSGTLTTDAITGLSNVAMSGSYLDLADQPTIPSITGLASEAFVTSAISDIELFSGDYNDLTNKPTIPSIAGLATETFVTNAIAGVDGFSGDYEDLTNKPVLFSGSYNDLTDKPVIPSIAGLATEGFVATAVSGFASESFVTDSITTAIDDLNFSGDYNDLTNKPTIPSIAGLATEAFVTSAIADVDGFSGSYNDLTDKPAIPSVTGLASETFVTSAISDIELFSGDYNDLTNKPTIPAAYTDASARNAISLVAGTSGATYTASTGVLDLSALATGGSGGGSIDTASNAGTGEAVFKAKTGSDLAFKTIKAGANISLTSTADEITIESTATGGGNADQYSFTLPMNQGNVTPTGASAEAIGIQNFPAGWTATCAGGVTVITHTTGKIPRHITFYCGTGSPSDPIWVYVTGGNTAATGLVKLPLNGNSTPSTTKFQFQLASAMGTIANNFVHAVVTF